VENGTLDMTFVGKYAQPVAQENPMKYSAISEEFRMQAAGGIGAIL